MTEATTFNKEEFTTKYLEFVRNKDLEGMMTLAGDVPAEDKEKALAAAIEAIESDEDLAKEAAEILGVLKSAQETNIAAAAVVEAESSEVKTTDDEEATDPEDS